MGMYHWFIAIAGIIFFSLIFVPYSHVTVTLQEKLTDSLPESVSNQTVDQQAIKDDFNFVETIQYFSFFLVSFVLLFWAYKKTVETQGRGI